MPSVQNFTYDAAATLAIDLVNARPKLDERKAADIAWQTYKEDEAPGPQSKFQTKRYVEDVMRAIREIRSGRHNRIEPGPHIWEKALEQLKRFQNE